MLRKIRTLGSIVFLRTKLNGNFSFSGGFLCFFSGTSC